ncbi:MAG: hypothetical protein ABIN25_01055 [Ginsengibacter sp.]
MKNILRILSIVITLFFIFSGCSGSKEPAGARHHRSVDHSGFRGY